MNECILTNNRSDADGNLFMALLKLYMKSLQNYLANVAIFIFVNWPILQLIKLRFLL